jgi:hypothetical protein
MKALLISKPCKSGPKNSNHNFAHKHAGQSGAILSERIPGPNRISPRWALPDRQQPGGKRHPTGRCGSEAIVVYWPSPGRMAQRGDLIDSNQLSTTWPQSRGISHRRASAPALDQDSPDPRTASRSVENLPQRIPLESRFEFWLIAAVAMKKTYTDKQGQYLAFIYYYSKIHRRPPAEAEMQEYFGVSPPSVHQMILTLETRGLIERTPGQARSIHLLISPEELPNLI